MNQGAVAKPLNLGANITVLKSADGNPTPGVIKISGYANTPEIDRSSDVVVWTEESIKNYKDNPILLFCHDRREPIGKCTLIEIRTEGLWVEAEIDTRWEKSYLIENETLKTMSVRFMASDYTYQQDRDCWLVKASDLLEISIEPIPDNPNARFQVAKTFDSTDEYNEFKKSKTTITTDPMNEIKKTFDAIMAKLKGAKAEAVPAIQEELKGLTASIDALSKGATDDKTKTAIADMAKGFQSELEAFVKTIEPEGEGEEGSEAGAGESSEDATEEIKTLKAELAEAKQKAKDAEASLAKSKGKGTEVKSTSTEDPTQGKDTKTGNEKAADESASYFKGLNY